MPKSGKILSQAGSMKTHYGASTQIKKHSGATVCAIVILGFSFFSLWLSIMFVRFIQVVCCVNLFILCVICKFSKFYLNIWMIRNIYVYIEIYMCTCLYVYVHVHIHPFICSEK